MPKALEINGRGMETGKDMAAIWISECLWIRYKNILSKFCIYYSKSNYNLN